MMALENYIVWIFHGSKDNMTKKILLITHNQFGYQIHMYEYAKYLRDDYDIKYLCFDYGRKKIQIPQVDVIYVERSSSRGKRLFDLLRAINQHLKKNRYDLIVLKYFPFASLVRLLFTKDKIFLNIRTGYTSSNSFRNFVSNSLLRLEASVFTDLIVLSESLRNYLGISQKKSVIIPLGAEVFSRKEYRYTSLDLIYVGTFNNRNIDETIIGFNKFYQNNKIELELSYTIIGFGSEEEEANIIKYIEKFNLEDVVKFIGLVPYNELPAYFGQCNVGVSYIPITPEYDVQPPTKTIEYLLSGLPTIATATKENKKLINHRNGALIDDTSDDFCRGLSKIASCEYDNSEIRKSVEEYRWEVIVNKKFKPLVQALIEK